ncbi:MAG: hypothetical protein U0Q15_02495 [Kineosporiaceae bacterium]
MSPLLAGVSALAGEAGGAREAVGRAVAEAVEGHATAVRAQAEQVAGSAARLRAAAGLGWESTAAEVFRGRLVALAAQVAAAAEEVQEAAEALGALADGLHGAP